MRILLPVFIFICSFHCVSGAIPQVPSSIEIAGVKLKLSNDAQEEIQKHVNALRASDKYFRIKLDRVNLYFPIIERVLKEEGVPEDLKYLAIQESALISDAVSSADAVGYWQFKDFTAREVGLRVDSKIDERKNIVSATRGAAKYFKRNNFFFKNWIYSVSAYQAGPGGAKRYVEKENFGSDKLNITKKTHWYVLKYIAHVIAFKEEIGSPHSEGLKLGEYTKGEGKSIEQVAREVKADEEQTKEYNKWIKHGKIPDDKVYTVIIPTTGKLPKMVAEKEDNNPPPLTRTIEKPEEKNQYPDHIAGSVLSKRQAIFLNVNGIEATMASTGDDIKSLAKKADIDPDKLLTYNDLKSTSTIHSGQIYYISKKRNRSPIYHHVAQYDESLWDISQKYGIKLDKLKKKNRITDNETLKPGRLMWLRKKRPSNEPVEYHEVKRPSNYNKKNERLANHRKPIVVETKKEEPEVKEPIKEVVKEPEIKPAGNLPKGDRVLHVIQEGETFWSLSRRYNVSVQDLADWNNLDNQASLSVGQEIIIIRPVSNELIKEKTIASEPRKEIQTEVNTIHTVAAGESLWAISQKYEVTVSDIRKWNGITDLEPINPGQELSIGQKTNKQKEHKTYVVKGGDSLYKIATDHDMSVDDLMQLNDLSSSALSVGQKLQVKEK